MIHFEAVTTIRDATFEEGAVRGRSKAPRFDKLEFFRKQFRLERFCKVGTMNTELGIEK